MLAKMSAQPKKPKHVETSYYPDILAYQESPAQDTLPVPAPICPVCTTPRKPYKCHAHKQLALHGHGAAPPSARCPHAPDPDPDPDAETAALLPCGHLVGSRCLAALVRAACPGAQDPWAGDWTGSLPCPVCRAAVRRDPDLCGHGIVFRLLERRAGEAEGQAAPAPATTPQGGRLKDVCLTCDWRCALDRYARAVNDSRARQGMAPLGLDEVKALPGYVGHCARFLEKITKDGSRLWSVRPSARRLVEELESTVSRGRHPEYSIESESSESFVCKDALVIEKGGASTHA